METDKRSRFALGVVVGGFDITVSYPTSNVLHRLVLYRNVRWRRMVIGTIGTMCIESEIGLRLHLPITFHSRYIITIQQDERAIILISSDVSLQYSGPSSWPPISQL